MQGFDQLLLLDPLSLLLIVVRTTVVYIVLLLAIRLSGKREVGQMTPFDLVLLLVLSNAVQNAMIGPDSSLNGGLLAALVLLGVNRALDMLGLRSAWLHKQLVGEPALLVHNGQPMAQHMQREGVTEEEIMQALREHGIENLSECKTVVLEVDGTISVVPASATILRTRRRVRGRKPAV